MSYETILLTSEAAVATLTLNRPDKLNSFTATMHQEMMDALEKLTAERSARALLITGAGRGFCAGQDLSDPAMHPDKPGFDMAGVIDSRYNRLVRLLRDLPMPTIAAINGVAAGAGANLALACDIVIAGKSASFIQAFSKIGLIPDSAGTWSLPLLVGQARAVALAMLGEKLPAEKAAEWGMIWKCVEDVSLMDEAKTLATQLSTMPTKALVLTRKAMDMAASNGISAQLDVERDLQKEAAAGHDYAEGVAAFLAKRPPNFTGN
jgi:2-(1,2-epoxy-1,2-dihydrophenyl)acetyl-CoA isomerase